MIENTIATEDTIRCDICVIGAGAGGLSVAAGAARMGASVVLVERAAMGGDCLNAGCVPSKALLAAAHAAAAVRGAGRFGIVAPEPVVDMPRVRDHLRAVIAAIAPHDSQERFEGLGVRVIRAHARFTAPDRVQAGRAEVRARRFVVATGSRPAIPPVPGLDGLPFLTNETIFALDRVPAHLLVLGGGPVGVEMAQAHRRLGARVTLVERQRLLPREDGELVAVLRARLAADGLTVVEGAAVTAAGTDPDGVALVLADGRRLTGSHLLVAAGRRAVVDDLGLDAAGIEAHAGGIVTDRRLRTANRRVFAVGDVAGGPAFTPVAAQHARVVLTNALFRWPARVDYRALPRVTYGAPELAQVGLTHAEAKAAHHGVRALRLPFTANDRAQAEGETEGMVKLVVGRGGRLLGAGIVGAGAGELLAPWCLALARRLPLSAMAGVMLPYPTRGEAGKAAAGAFFTPTLYGTGVRRLVRLLGWLG